MSKQFTLSRNERLKSRKLIEQLFSSGKSFSVPPYRVSFLAGEKIFRDDIQHYWVQCGFGAASRKFKKAADRNRIKRLTREAWRLQKQELSDVASAKQQQLAVFLVYTGRELPDFALAEKKVAVILNKLIAVINETTIAAS